MKIQSIQSRCYKCFIDIAPANTKISFMHKEITNWTYQKGELAEDRFFTTVMLIATVVSVLLTILLIAYLPSNNLSYLFGKTKIGGWLMAIPIILIWIVIFFVFNLLHAILFSFYKKIVGIQPESIRFAADKITTLKKEWILNDDLHSLSEVKIENPDKDCAIAFAGTKKQEGKENGKYNYAIPVPVEEMHKAKQIVAFFQTNHSSVHS